MNATSPKVHFKNAASEIAIEHGETVLDAAIRYGLYVNYGCGSGNCGLCRARLIEGEISKVHHCDYFFTQTQKSENYFLMCAHTAATDLVIDAAVSNSASQLEPYEFQAKVREIELFNDKVASLVLQPPRSLRLRFISGQYARLAGNNASGEFSIASCPCDGRRLAFHIPHSANDEFGDYIFKSCSFNDVIQVTAPFGEFVFSEDFSRPVALVAVDGGFAPIKSLFEHISAQESEVPICLYRISTWGDDYLDNLCRSWADSLDQVTYCAMTAAAPTVSDNKALNACLSRVISELSRLETVDVYCCAPAWIGKALEAAWPEREDKRVFWEPLRYMRYGA